MSIDYSGWKQLSKINIIYSNYDTKTYNGKEYRKAYIVEAGTTKANQKSMESGIRWAQGRYYGADKSMPTITETDNSDFIFQIVSAAGNSWSQGGKLSFWMCLIEKEGIEPFMVGINADLLADLILESTVYKGSVKEKVFFARKNSQLGVLHENMPSYQELLKDQQRKKDVSKGKTTKWKIGYEYNTLTQTSVMFGYFTPIAISKYVNGRDPYSSYSSNAERTLVLDFNAKEKPFFNSIYKDWQDSLADIVYYNNRLPDKCPSRQEGNQVFEYTDSYYEDAASLILKGLNSSYTNFTHSLYTEGAFLIFTKAPDKTIEMLETIRDKYKLAISNIENRIPDELNQHVFDNTRYFSCESIIYKYQLRKNIDYNGKRETFYNDIIGYYDRLIEIAKIEKAKLGK